MERMVSLRHLNLKGCKALRYMPRGIGQLTGLRTLTTYPVGDESTCGGLQELKDLNIGGMLCLSGLEKVRNVVDAKDANLVSKNNLEYLTLEWGQVTNGRPEVGNALEVLEALKPPHNIKQFKIRNYFGNQFPTWLMEEDLKLYRNLIDVSLMECRGCDRVPPLDQLPSIEHLLIVAMDSLKHMDGSEFYGSGEHIVSLKRLFLSENINLEKWSGVEGKTSLPHVVELTICRCPKLTTIPSLPSVQRLRITICPLLLPFRGFFRSMKSLAHLCLDSCDKLVSMLLEEEEDNQAGLPLESLYITGCAQSTLSTSGGGWRRLSSLQTLDIACCESLNLPKGLIHLTSLVDLNIVGLSELTSLPEGMECLKALQRLKIISCQKLISLPKGLQKRLPFLKFLEINLCPSLEALCSRGGEYWDLISNIPNLSIGL